MTRAKFTVTHKSEPRQVTKYISGKTEPEQVDVVDIHLMPVIGGSPENNRFYAMTPTGTIQLSTVNMVAANEFEVVKEYYIDFSPAN